MLKKIKNNKEKYIMRLKNNKMFRFFIIDKVNKYLF